MLKGYLIGLHVLALIAGIGNALPDWLKLMLVMTIALHYLVMQNKFIKRLPGSKLKFSSISGWELAIKTNYDPIQILKTTVITRFVIILHFLDQNRKKRSILICKDSLAAEEFRKLTIELKISENYGNQSTN